jgi:hypothetical protein
MLWMSGVQSVPAKNKNKILEIFISNHDLSLFLKNLDRRKRLFADAPSRKLTLIYSAKFPKLQKLVQDKMRQISVVCFLSGTAKT